MTATERTRTHGLMKGYHHHFMSCCLLQPKSINWNLWCRIKCLETLVSLWTLSVAHCRHQWRGEQLCLCPFRVISKKRRSSQSLDTEHRTSRGDSHQQSPRQRVQCSQLWLFLLSNVEELCHFRFNMQRSLKGMLYRAFIKGIALPDCPCVCLVHPGSAGHLQVGTRCGRPSIVTSKLTDCRRTSRHSAYCWLNIY